MSEHKGIIDLETCGRRNMPSSVWYKLQKSCYMKVIAQKSSEWLTVIDTDEFIYSVEK